MLKYSFKNIVKEGVIIFKLVIFKINIPLIHLNPHFFLSNKIYLLLYTAYILMNSYFIVETIRLSNRYFFFCELSVSQSQFNLKIYCKIIS